MGLKYYMILSIVKASKIKKNGNIHLERSDPRRPIKGVYMAVLEQKDRRAISQFNILK